MRIDDLMRTRVRLAVRLASPVRTLVQTAFTEDWSEGQLREELVRVLREAEIPPRSEGSRPGPLRVPF